MPLRVTNTKAEVNVSVRSAAPRLKAISLFIAFSLAVYFYLLIKPTYHSHPQEVFSCLATGADPALKEKMPASWKSRVAGPMIAGWMLDAIPNPDTVTREEFSAEIFALYNAGWIFLTFLALVLFRKDALVIMLGTAAGILFTLSQPADVSFYPFDFPAQFFFTLGVLLYDRGKMWALLPVIVIGGLFKETVLLCALLILVYPGWSLGRRIAAFVSVVVIRFALCHLLMAHYGQVGRVVAVGNASTWGGLISPWNIFDNVRSIFSPHLHSVIFLGAGSVLIAILIPWRDRREVILKSLLLLFCLGELDYGVAEEVRIWYEVQPLAWMLISEYLATYETASTPWSLRLRRIQWLVLGLLFSGLLVLRVVAAGYISTSDLPRAADKGDANAQYRLGCDYLYGTGVYPDADRAVELLLAAATNGNASARETVDKINREGFGGIKPDFGNAHNNLGAALFSKGRIDEAMEQFQEAIALNPNVAEPHDNLGLALARKGRLDEAISQYQEALRIQPENAQFHFKLGLAFDTKGDFDDAVDQYQEALRLKPDYAEAHNDLGQDLMKKGRLDEAITQFQEALRLQPDFVVAHNNLGAVLLNKDRIDEAISQFQEALRLKPDYAHARFNLGNALLAKGRIDEAIEQFQTALRLDPNLAPARDGLARALQMKNAPTNH